jgi:hypothetical protein
MPEQDEDGLVAVLGSPGAQARLTTFSEAGRWLQIVLLPQKAIGQPEVVYYT